MTFDTRFAAAATLAIGVALASGGCVVQPAEPCYDECYYEVYCDAWGCWEEEICECVEYVYDDQVVECYDDYDCGSGWQCLGGWCEPIDDPQPAADAGFCEPCTWSSDCADPDSLCIELGQEVACGRACEADADCPGGFECLDVSQQAGVSDQCVPVADDEGLRSCTLPEPDPECRQDRDCAAGQSCIQQTCIDTGACELNSDCAADEVCEDGACQPAATPECRQDRDCDEGLACDDGACVDPCAQPGFQCDGDCQSDDECAEGQLCDDQGQCVDDPASCVADDECAEGQNCDDQGQCVDDPQACEADEDCEGAICLEGLCAPPQCTMSEDCGAEGEFVCVGGHCEDACAEDLDCAAGQMCNGLGFCSPDPDAECAEDADCPEGMSCVDAACMESM